MQHATVFTKFCSETTLKGHRIVLLCLVSSLIDRNAMLLLCNIIVNEGIARGVLPVLNAV